MKTIIVTGVSGYIGGQTALQLKDAGYKVIGIDNRPLPQHLLNICDEFLYHDFASNEALMAIYYSTAEAIIHCAGTSLVGPSVANPEEYYQNNFVRTKRMLDSLVQGQRLDIRVIFSSSASVYGEPVLGSCQEEDPALPLSPYGESKYMTEMMMQSYFRAYGLQPVMFRYFNACGADSQGRHGQEPGATHVIARILEATRDNGQFEIYGNNYSTTDGTCIRDYVHVEDIARAHIMAISSEVPTGVYNLGSNEGTSVKQIIERAAIITGRSPEITVSTPRSGDPETLTASANRFTKVQPEWRKYTLDDMISHAWNWYVR